MHTRLTQIPAGEYILLADDDKDDCMLFNRAFKELNFRFQLCIVNDGMELMNFLRQTHMVLPQLIFLDINMPQKNGVECLNELKESESLKNIPVILYSTSDYEGDALKGSHLQAHLYIKKPNSFSQLKNVIQKVLIYDFANHLSNPPKGNFLIISDD